MTRTYLVIFEKGKEGWGAWAPDLPGTGGAGDTLEETRASLKEGIGYTLEYALEENQPFPEAQTTTVDFAEFNPNPADSHYEIEWMTVDLPAHTEATSHTGNQQATAA